MRVRLVAMAVVFLFLPCCSSRPLFVWTPGPQSIVVCPDRVVSFDVTVGTAEEANAGTDDGVALDVRVFAGTCELTFPNLSGDDREEGEVETYHLPIGPPCHFNVKEVVANEVFLRIKGSDLWLPSSVRVVANTEDGRAVEIENRSWPSELRFSTNARDCERGDFCQESWRVNEPAP